MPLVTAQNFIHSQTQISRFPCALYIAGGGKGREERGAQQRVDAIHDRNQSSATLFPVLVPSLAYVSGLKTSLSHPVASEVSERRLLSVFEAMLNPPFKPRTVPPLPPSNEKLGGTAISRSGSG